MTILFIRSCGHSHTCSAVSHSTPARRHASWMASAYRRVRATGTSVMTWAP